jgi:hypothetical protein
MKCSLWIALLLLAWSAARLLAQAAPEGTPERAIQDMALASKPEEIEKHLPVLILDDVKTLPAEDRRAFEASLLWRQSMLGEQSGLVLPEDGNAFLVAQTSDAQHLEVQLSDSVATGGDAVLRFAVGGPVSVRLEVLVWMRFEEGEWRIRELDPGRFGRRIQFDDLEFVERFRNREQKANESSATSTLYTLHYALQRYAAKRPEVGFPDDLSLLAEQPANDEDGSDEPNSVAFLSTEMARNDSESGGYRFHYQLLRGGPQGAYQITARPVDLAKSGRFSYLINELGEVHQTAENHDATSDDPILGANEAVVVAVD